MLTGITLTNFRRFEHHAVPLKAPTVIVGPNNAGKSTIAEAIRLLSLVANRAGDLQYIPAPEWLLSEPAGVRGVRPGLRDLNTNLERAFHAYSDPPASIEGQFSSKASITAYIGPNEDVYAVIKDPTQRVVMSKAHARRIDLPGIAIQPQVGPLSPTERLLEPRTVRRGLDSPLASSHFRNQLHLLGDPVRSRFKGLAESTWPGLQVQDLTTEPSKDGASLSLYIRDGVFVGEVASMGHGLQMWLQVVWFLARNENAPTVVLDEPDVYLHADLQRKLIRLVLGGHQQAIVATHSVEIMSEVPPQSILAVNSRGDRSRWTTSLKGVQRIVDSIGGVHNLQLARLANARRCMYLEGDDDVAFMSALHDAVDPSAESLGVIPHLKVGGWDGWQRVVGSSQFLRNAIGDAIMSYAIFDSDYHTPERIVERYAEAVALGVRLHVWLRKEIENYLVSATCIQRVISEGTPRSGDIPSVSDVELAISEAAAALIQEATDDCATEYQQADRGLTVATANRRAREYVDARRAELNGDISVVSGKKLLRDLSAWSDAELGVTFGPASLARAMRAEEIPAEVADVLRALRQGRAVAQAHMEVWERRSAS